MFWSIRRFSCRQSLGSLGAEMYPTGPLFGRGMSPFNIAFALGSMLTMFPGYGRRVSGFTGSLQPEATTTLKLGEPVSHSLKSPCRMRMLGTLPETTVPSRNRVQLCDQKKNVFD